MISVLAMILAAQAAPVDAAADPAAQGAARSAAPVYSPGSWVTHADYPVAALRAGLEGTTGFRIAVDGEGRVSSCVIISSSGHAVLDHATCELVTRRARFTPAVDASGRPVVSHFSSRIRWELPERTLPPLPEAMVLTVSMVVEKDGSVSECAILRAEGTAAARRDYFQPRVCPPTGFSAPFLNAAGEPVRRRVTMLREVTVEDIPE